MGITLFPKTIMRNRLYTFSLCLITLFAGCTRGLWLDEIVAQRDEQEEVVPILEAAKEKGLTVDSAEEIERTNKYYTVDTANGYYNEFKRYRLVFSDQTTVEFDVLGQLNGVQDEYYEKRELFYISEISWSDSSNYLSIDLYNPAGGGVQWRISFPITATLDDPNDNPNDNITYEKLTIVEFLAVPEDASVYYELTGVITNVINTHYGNFYLVDDTGEVFVYGLIDKDGNLCYSNYGLKNGDTITIRGRRSSYNGEPQMANAVYVSHIVGSDEDVDAIENRKIYYTSTDRMIVTPNARDVFGANIISNTYADGQGVITFDGNVTKIGDSAFVFCSSLTSITIPDSVTSIGNEAFRGCSSLASITIPEGVTSIGDNAFYNCSSLESITIPQSVTSIGNSAFADCSSLTSITIPEGVTSIGDYAFWGCSSLASITIPEGVTSIGKGAFSGCSSLASVTIPDSVTSIGNHAFHSCTSLASVTLPDSVTSIGVGAFSACTSLASITIPEGVTSIGEGTFSGCSSLASVTIPEGVTSIDSWAFEKCSSLVSITIPEEVTWVGSSAFTDCTSLASVYCKPKTPPTTNVSQPPFDNNASGRKIYVPAESVEAYKTAEWWSDYADDFVAYDFEKGEVVNLESRKIYYTSTDGNVVTPYATNVFGANIVSNTYENGLGVITFDGEVTKIGDNAFRDCSSLVSITIPEGVTSIGRYAFRGCSSLASVTLPDSVTSIGQGAFSNCSSLASITIPDNVTSIGGFAFEYCSSLTSITIPDSVTSIETYAFDNCTSLASITIPDGVTSIGYGAFYNCSSLTSITIPDSVTSIGENAFCECSSLAEFSGKFASEDGRCLIINGNLNSFAPAGLTEYVIPNGVTTIEHRAFFECDELVSVTIPDEVISIKEEAFRWCDNLASINIPDSVTSIGREAFSYCRSLAEVYCKATTPPTAVPNYDSTYWDAFDDNASERKIYVPTESVEAYKTAEWWRDYAANIVGYRF